MNTDKKAYPVAPETVLAFFLIVMFAVAFLWKVVFLGKVLLPADLLLRMAPWKHQAYRFPDFHQVYNPLLDVIQQHYPWRLFAAREIRQGILPLWNPYMYSGTPFVANCQSAIFYPLNFLFYLIPVKYAFGLTALLHLVLAGLGMYGFARLWVRSTGAALCAAVPFMFCGFFVTWLEFQTFLCTGVWLPWALWMLELSFRKESARFSALAGAALGLSLLAGHLQVAFYVLLVFGCYAIFRGLGILLDPLRRISFLKLAGLAALSIVIGFCLGAPQLFPVLELSRYSTRSGEFAFSGIWGRRLPAEELIRLLIPNFFGNPVDYNYWGSFNYVELTGYAGVVPFVLAVIALILRCRKLVLFWWGMILFCLLIATATPLYRLLLIFPGFRQFAAPARTMFPFAFSLAFLGALGVDSLSRISGEQRIGRLKPTLWGVLLISLAVLVVSLLLHSMTFLSDAFMGYGMAQVSWFLCILGIGSLLIWYGSARANQFSRVLSLIVLLLVVDQFHFGLRFNPAMDPGMVYFSTDSIEFLKRDTSLYRVVCAGTDFLNWTPSNCLMSYQISDIQGSDSLWLASYDRVLRRARGGGQLWQFKDYDDDLLDWLNCKYVVSAVPLPPSKKRSLVHEGDLYIYRRVNYQPRAGFLPEDSVKCYPMTLQEARHRYPEWFARRYHSSCSLVRYSPNAVDIRVRDLPPYYYLLLADTKYVGWRVFVDGKEDRMLRKTEFCSPGNRTLDICRLVKVPAGNHSVSFQFLPNSIKFGIFLAMVALSLMMALIIREKGQTTNGK